MKTEAEIQAKLQEVECQIINMGEAERMSETKEDRETYKIAKEMAASQAQALKWVLI
jgi:hypothetical protein